jgi:hypothetical protein
MTIRLSTGLQNRLVGINTELITNGTFTTVTTGWTSGSATLTSEASGQSGNCLRVAESGGANPGTAYQDVTTVVGQLYKLSLYFKKGTAAAGAFYVGTTVDADAIYASPALSDAAWAQKTIAFIATATTTRITLESTDATAAEYSEFDTVSLVCKSNSLQDALNLAQFEVYTGSQPADADDAPTGTKLVTIKSGGSTGVTWKDAVNGVNGKTATETWNGVGVADGTAGWFRICLTADSGASSTTDCRIDGSCGTSAADLNFASLAFSAGATQTISDFALSIPMEE